MAPGRRQRGGFEAQAQPDGARDPGRVEDEDPQPLFRPFDRADPGPRGDERRDLDGQGRLADPAGEAEDAHEAQPGQDVRNRERLCLHLSVAVRRIRLRRSVLLGPDDAQSGRLLPHRPLRAFEDGASGHRGSGVTPGVERRLRRTRDGTPQRPHSPMHGGASGHHFLPGHRRRMGGPA